MDGEARHKSMEPAGGMTEVFRENNRGVAANPALHPTRSNTYVYISSVITNIISHSCEKNLRVIVEKNIFERERERERGKYRLHPREEDGEREKEGEKESKSSWLVPEKTLRAAGCRRSIMKIPVYLLLHVDPEPSAKSNYGSRNVIDERLNLLPR